MNVQQGILLRPRLTLPFCDSIRPHVAHTYAKPVIFDACTFHTELMRSWRSHISDNHGTAYFSLSPASRTVPTGPLGIRTFDLE